MLENSNKQADNTLGTSRSIEIPEWHNNNSIVEWKTPSKSADIREQARLVTGLETVDQSTARVLFRKLAKGIDEKDFVIAQQERKIKQLENKIEQLKPRKRRKVVTSPNSKFATIDDIMRAQIEAGDRPNVLLDSDEAISVASTLSYITINE